MLAARQQVCVLCVCVSWSSEAAVRPLHTCTHLVRDTHMMIHIRTCTCAHMPTHTCKATMTWLARRLPSDSLLSVHTRTYAHPHTHTPEPNGHARMINIHTFAHTTHTNTHAHTSASHESGGCHGSSIHVRPKRCHHHTHAKQQCGVCICRHHPERTTRVQMTMQ